MEAAISVPRARTYLLATTDVRTGRVDPAAAVRLYEHNVRLASAVWSSLADIEIVLRNVVAGAINVRHANQRPDPNYRWYDEPSWFPANRAWWTEQTKVGIRQAMRRARDPGPGNSRRPSEGKVIAELSLGFWRYLLIPRYEHSLWNPAIRARFSGLAHLSGSDSRKLVYRRLEALNVLRNRVAHHEPVFRDFVIPGHRGKYEPATVLREALEIVSWGDADAARWIAERDSVQRLWRKGADNRLRHLLRRLEPPG